MNNFFILIPNFNDWVSLNKLLFHLNKSIKQIKGKFKVIIINDCSTEKINLETKNLTNIKSIKVLNLKKNVGSQKAIFIGLKYIQKINYKSIIAILDSDGEDNPFKLKKLINLALKKKKFIVVADRSKRMENIFLRFLNYLRLIGTFFLTGKYINFGNFSAFYSTNLKKIFLNNNLWFAYSAGILKNCKNIERVSIEKKERYYGASKVNLTFLLSHSLKIICVFKKEIFVRSFFAVVLIILIFKNLVLDVKIIVLFLILNISVYAYYQINNLNFDALKLIKNKKNIKTNNIYNSVVKNYRRNNLI